MRLWKTGRFKLIEIFYLNRHAITLDYKIKLFFLLRKRKDCNSMYFSCWISKWQRNCQICFSFVHRYVAEGSTRACRAAGPSSIPGRDKFPGWDFFGVFLTYKTKSGPPGPRISYHIRLVGVNGCVNGVYRLSCLCCPGDDPGIELFPYTGCPPCLCVVKKLCMWSKVNSLSRQFVTM